MEKLPQEHNEGNQQEIVVQCQGGRPDQRQVVKVSDVLIGEADWLKQGLAERLDSPEVAKRIFTWLRRRLPTTLTLELAGHASRPRKKRSPRCADQFIEDLCPATCWPRPGKPLKDDTVEPAGAGARQLPATNCGWAAGWPTRWPRWACSWP